MSQSKSRKERMAETRARLTACAKEELLTKGFEKMTLRSVAECAGVALGTVMLHFETKQALLHSALYSDLTACWEEIKLNPVPESIHQEIAKIFDGLFSYYTSNPVLSRELLRESMFASEPWREKFVELAGDLHTEVAIRLSRAQEAGQKMSKKPAPLLALSLVSFYYFSLISWVQQAVPQPSTLFTPLSQNLLSPEEAAK